MKLKDEINETERHGVDEAKRDETTELGERSRKRVPSEFAGILTYRLAHSRAFLAPNG